MAQTISRALLESRRIVADLRVIDPQRFRIEPLPAGRALDPIVLNPKQAEDLLVGAAFDLAGVESTNGVGFALWRSGGSELLLALRINDAVRLRVRLADGLIAFSLPVACAETQPNFSQVHVSFGVGSAKRPAGLLATAEQRPRGQPAVVDLWGERMTAFCWNALLALATSLAAESGRDEDGAPLLPGALSASANGLTVQPMARHEFDRVTASAAKG